MLLSLLATAVACSCGRPPFAVVGGPDAIRHAELVGAVPAPSFRQVEPGLEVPPMPVLTVTRMPRGPYGLETRAGSARFVRLDNGVATPAVVVRRRRPAGIERHVQVDLRPARALEPGAAYALEMASYPGSRHAQPYGIRLEVRASISEAAVVPEPLAWEFQAPGGSSMCLGQGWTLLIGDLEANATRYDLFVLPPDGPPTFWGTFAGPVVGNTGDRCRNYAFGADAPPAMPLRVVPRDLAGHLGEPLDVVPPERPRVEGEELLGPGL